MERLHERIKGGGGGGVRGRKQNFRRERERACQPTAVTIIHHHKYSGKHMHAHAHTHSHACIHSCYWAVQWSWFAQVYALCNLSCKKSWEVTVSLPGWFLSRCCFMLCITMEVEPWIAKQYKCHHYCSCKNYWGKGMESGKKVSSHLLFFFSDPKISISWKKCILGHPVARATSYCLLPNTFWLQASKNAFGEH